MNSSKSGYGMNTLRLQAGLKRFIDGHDAFLWSHALKPEAKVLVLSAILGNTLYRPSTTMTICNRLAFFHE